MNSDFRLFIATLIIITAGIWAVSAHALTLKDFQGESRNLDHLKQPGKWMIVMIWASDCHVCNAEAPAYALFHESHKDNDAHIVGVSLDGFEGIHYAKSFVTNHDLPFPNLIAEPRELVLHYAELTGESFRGTPSFLVYDTSGNLVAAQAGAVPTEVIEAFITRNSTSEQ